MQNNKRYYENVKSIVINQNLHFLLNKNKKCYILLNFSLECRKMIDIIVIKRYILNVTFLFGFQKKLKGHENRALADCRKRIYLKIVIVNFCYIAKPSLEGRCHSDLSLWRKGGRLDELVYIRKSSSPPLSHFASKMTAPLKKGNLRYSGKVLLLYILRLFKI